MPEDRHKDKADDAPALRNIMLLIRDPKMSSLSRPLDSYGKLVETL